MKRLILLGLIITGLVAMDDDHIKEKVKHTLEQQGIDVNNVHIITSSDLPAQFLEKKQETKNKIDTDINNMTCVYRALFEDMRDRDLKKCSHTTFKLRLPSLYIKNLLNNWSITFKKYPSFQNKIVFTQVLYQQIDKKFVTFYKQHKDIAQAWNLFIKYFLNEIIEPYRQVKDFFE